jgi:dCTP deaminase
MIFSDRDIRRLMSEGAIAISPAPDFTTQLGSCSLDLKLGTTFKVFRDDLYGEVVINPLAPSNSLDFMKEVVVEDGGSFVLQPHSFVLAITHEHVELADNIVARLEGRSSLGRLGIIVHATASIIDPGWKGKIVLELANHGALPVALHPGMRICALTFELVSTSVDVPYWRKVQAKYINQQSTLSSRIFEDIDANGSIQE